MANFPLFKESSETYRTRIRGAQEKPHFLYLKVPGTEQECQIALEVLSVCHEGSQKVWVEFGVYREVLRQKFTLVPGQNPEQSPFKLVRQGGKSFFDQIPTHGWLEGERYDLTRAHHGVDSLGVHELQKITPDFLVFAPSPQFKDIQKGLVLSLCEWQPLWSLWVPPQAGIKGNASVSGFEGGHSHWLSLKKSRPLILKDSLWVRFPENPSELALTFHLGVGVYPL